MIRSLDSTHKEEPSITKKTWIESNQILLKVIFNVLALYGASAIYIQIWRMITGH